MKTLEEQGFTIIKQGAEGRLYSGIYLGKPAVVKERFIKSYRHPDLDRAITKERIKAESRAIVRCKSAGIKTPCLYLVDFERRCIFMENFVNNITVKDYIFKHTEKTQDEDLQKANDKQIRYLTQQIGTILATMHRNNIIHGDLTTSNMLLIPNSKENHSNNIYDKAEIILIDFGLSHIDSSAEDKGVDLYVLERALNSTHSICPHLFSLIFDVYVKQNKLEAKEVIQKYEEIRARGRKRTMVG